MFPTCAPHLPARPCPHLRPPRRFHLPRCGFQVSIELVSKRPSRRPRSCLEVTQRNRERRWLLSFPRFCCLVVASPAPCSLEPRNRNSVLGTSAVPNAPVPTGGRGVLLTSSVSCYSGAAFCFGPISAGGATLGYPSAEAVGNRPESDSERRRCHTLSSAIAAGFHQSQIGSSRSGNAKYHQDLNEANGHMRVTTIASAPQSSHPRRPQFALGATLCHLASRQEPSSLVTKTSRPNSPCFQHSSALSIVFRPLNISPLHAVNLVYSSNFESLNPDLCLLQVGTRLKAEDARSIRVPLAPSRAEGRSPNSGDPRDLSLRQSGTRLKAKFPLTYTKQRTSLKLGRYTNRGSSISVFFHDLSAQLTNIITSPCPATLSFAIVSPPFIPKEPQ
jgi:hypothetical protein